jgi:two-component system response regulator DevR
MLRPTATPVAVLLVDRHEIARRRLREVIAKTDGIEVVGEAATTRAGVSEFHRLHPDVVVMGMRFPDGSGIEACRAIRKEVPTAKVLIRTAVTDESSAMEALLAGAAGYVLKDLDPQELVDDVFAVAQGGSVVEPRLMTSALERARQPRARSQDDLWSTLSPVQVRLADLIGDGLTNREIAEELSLSQGTISNYNMLMYRKLGVRGRVDVARLVAERRKTRC